MRKTVISVAVLLCASAFALGVSADGDDKQSGDNSDCLDYNVLYNVPGVHSPLSVFVDVTEGAVFSISSSSGVAYIDFHDIDGNWLGYNDAQTTEVPEHAVYGSVCVTNSGGYPDIPEPLATWTYSES